MTSTMSIALFTHDDGDGPVDYVVPRSELVHGRAFVFLTTTPMNQLKGPQRDTVGNVVLKCQRDGDGWLWNHCELDWFGVHGLPDRDLPPIPLRFWDLYQAERAIHTNKNQVLCNG